MAVGSNRMEESNVFRSMRIFITLSLLAVVGCASPAPSATRSSAAPAASSTQPRTAAQITVGSSEEPVNLNPLNVLPHHFPQHAPYLMIFDSLLQVAPDGTLKPRLAQSWQAAPDNLSFTFMLNPA